MTLDWWGLGLQAVNVLILVWLLSRVFWRPVAEAIARRQQAARALLDEGAAAQARADTALAEVAAARAGIAAERDAVLAEARAAADSARAAALAEAQAQADALTAAARVAIDRDRDGARKETAAQAAALSVEIAARLLARFATPEVRAGFLDRLVAAIDDLPAGDRAALAASTEPLEIVAASEPDAAERARIVQAVTAALGGTPALAVAADPDLIAGLELRSAHFVLHNSWRADLVTILSEVADAG